VATLAPQSGHADAPRTEQRDDPRGGAPEDPGQPDGDHDQGSQDRPLAWSGRPLVELSREIRVVAAQPHLDLAQPALPMTLAFAATADRPTAVLTDPSTVAGSNATPPRPGPTSSAGA
jgi:hypothetical protein